MKHKHTVKSMDMNNAIARHLWSTVHHTNWEGFRIIGHEEDFVKRKLLEGMKIKNNKNNINMDEE